MSSKHISIDPKDWEVAGIALREYRRQAKRTVERRYQREEPIETLVATVNVAYVRGFEKALAFLGLPIPQEEEGK